MKKNLDVVVCVTMLLLGTAVFAQRPTVTPTPQGVVLAVAFPMVPPQGGASPAASPAATSTASPVVTPAASPAGSPQCPTAPANPQLTGPIREGATQISGIGSPFPSSCPVQVNVYDVSNAAQPQLLANSATGQTVDSNKGNFVVPLAEPLREGQKIAVAESFNGTSYPATTALGTGTDVVVPGDWGRVKAYFTSGILVSQNQQSFSQSSLYIGFTLDKSWMLPGYYHPRPMPSPSPSPATHMSRKGAWWRPGLNTFFDVRLTQIPVSACSSTATTTSNQASPCATPAATPSPSPAATPSPLNTFLSSQKTARLAVGIYFPFSFTTWSYNKIPNALFIAPLAKVGFDTPAGALSQIEPSSTGSGAATSTTGTVTAVNQANFYNFYSFGARIGHYALTNTSDRAPDLVSYLDVSFGPFSNLESLVIPATAPLTTVPNTKRLYRVNVEGILKVPTTPLIVGLSANVGQEALGTGGIRIVQRAGDDLRFLFGVRFDVAKLLSKVTAIAP